MVGFRLRLITNLRPGQYVGNRVVVIKHFVDVRGYKVTAAQEANTISSPLSSVSVQINLYSLIINSKITDGML